MDSSCLSRLATALDSRVEDLDWHMQCFLGECKVRLKGARVLDVGAGKGPVSMYAACCEARQVVSLEPEAAGSTRGVRDEYESLRDLLHLPQCELLAVDVMVYCPEEPFDLVLLHDSINHIREVTTDIRRDGPAREAQRQVVAKLASLTRLGGWLVISDCSRRNFFNDIGLGSPWPFARRIGWRKHQTPSAWCDLLREEGLQPGTVSRYVPRKLGAIALIVGSAAFNYFTYSWFALRAHRPESACLRGFSGGRS